MKTRAFFYFLLLFLSVSCTTPDKSHISDVLGIEEPKKWILIIHPEGCKTCLDSLYDKLMQLEKDTPGAIVILAKNSKTLRMQPLIGNSPIPLYLDEQKVLIDKGLVELTDQILWVDKDQIQKFDILEYQKVLDLIKVN